MIYLTGDMHGKIDSSRYRFFANFMEEEDILIVLGDFGFVWYGVGGDQRNLDKLSRLCKGTILFIAGNHENYNSLYQDYPINDFKGIRVHNIRDNIKHILPNQIFELEGKSFLPIDGAFSIDREHRVLNRTWWEQEIPSLEELENFISTVKENQTKIEYILSHEAPLNVKVRLINNKDDIRVPKEYENNMTQVLQNAYEILLNNHQFKHWYFGHYHDDKKIDLSSSCLYRTIEEIK